MALKYQEVSKLLYVSWFLMLKYLVFIHLLVNLITSQLQSDDDKDYDSRPKEIFADIPITGEEVRFWHYSSVIRRGRVFFFHN